MRLGTGNKSRGSGEEESMAFLMQCWRRYNGQWECVLVPLVRECATKNCSNYIGVVSI